MPIKKDFLDKNAFLKELYKNEGNPVKELAKIFNIKSSTLYNWISQQDAEFKAIIKKYKSKGGDKPGRIRTKYKKSPKFKYLETPNNCLLPRGILT